MTASISPPKATGCAAPVFVLGAMAATSPASSMKNPAEAERIFNELAVGGTVQMPLEKTFWAAKFGMLVDRFGIPWMINCEQASA